MKKKRLLLGIGLLLALTSQGATATQIYSSEKLNDGTYIRKCRYSNGKIDYCTQKDALKAIEVFNNPWKYMTPAQKAQWEKNNKEAKARELAEKNAIVSAKNKFQAEFPISKKVDTTFMEYQKEYKGIIRNKDLGLPYDEEKLNTLESKIRMLDNLKDPTGQTSPFITGYIALSTEGLRYKYEKILEQLNTKVITQDEFNYLKAQLKKDAELLEGTYNKVVTTSGKVFDVGSEEGQRELRAKEASQSAMQNASQKTTNNYYTDPKSPLNILNTTTNTIQAGKNLIEQLKMFKGL